MFKKIYFLFFAILFFAQFTASSQTEACKKEAKTITLLQDKIPTSTCDLNGSNSHLYVGRDYVDMLPGFQYIPGSGKHFEAKTDNSLVVAADYYSPVDVSTRQINTSLPVGSIPGSASVSLTGSATYTIPIHTPPGTAGMQPNISIAYNSHAGNGLLGWGWNIAGLSVISRTPRTIYHDQQTGAVNLNTNDRFALDGNRLIVTNGSSYGANGTIYHTEIETFNQVESKGSQGNGPEWFEVKTKEGLTMEYGNTNDSRFITEDGSNTVILWRINKISDQNNNYMEFKYNNDNRESRIEEINYTGNSSMLPYNSIKFYYSTRNDKNHTWVAGQSINSNLLLRMIRVYAEDMLVKEYEMKYAENLQSQLAEIIEYAQDRTAYNSTVFEYGTAQLSSFYENVSLTDDGTTVQAEYRTGDYNGDGKTDIVAFTYTYNSSVKEYDKWLLYINTDVSGVNVSNFDKVSEGDLPDGFAPLSKFGHHGDKAFISNGFINIASEPVDINGDGMQDLLITSALSGVRYYTPYISTGSSFTPMAANAFSIDVSGNYIFTLGDLNGDGKLEGIVYNKDTQTWVVNFFDKNETNYISSTNYTINDQSPIYLIDHDGNGTSELLVWRSGKAVIFKFNITESVDASGNHISYHSTITEIYNDYFPLMSAKIFPGDFNGDMKTDLMYYYTSSSGYNWDIGYSMGINEYFFKPLELGFFSISDTTNNLYLVQDMNGDNLADVITYFRNEDQYGNNYFRILLNKGNALNATLITGEVIINSDSHGKIKEISSGDLNGDGYKDVLIIYENGLLQVFYHHLNQFYDIGNSNLLTTVVNGLNQKTTFDYSTLAKGGDFYTRSGTVNHPIYDYPMNIHFVESMSNSDGIGGLNTTAYHYEGARVHIHGKGFLGFTKITAKNSTANRIVTTTNELNNTFFYLSPKTTEVKTMSNSSITTTNFTNALHDAYGNKRFFPYVQSSTSTDHLTGITTTENFTYNVDGNFTNYQSTAGSASTQITNDYSTFSSWWIPSRLKSTTITKQLGAEPSYSRTISYTYDSNGRLENKISDPGKTKQVTTHNRYLNPFGNISSTAISSGGLHGWAEEFEFDSKGRFVTKHSTFLGSTLSEYEPAYGNITKRTSVDGLISTYQYDAFGRPVTTNTPQGNTITASYNWVTDNNPVNAVYFMETKAPGAPDNKTYYDILGNPLMQEADGYVAKISTEKNYNNAGQLISETQPHSQSEAAKYINYTYNNTYNYLENIDNNGLKTTHSISGKTKTFTNPAGQQFTKTIDDAGNLSNATSPGGNVTYTYHSSGLPKTITDGSNTTTIEYDEYGRQKLLTDPDAGTTQYEYNAFGDLIMQQDANGNKTELTYDHLRRMELKTITDKNNNTINVKYTYITSGNGLGNIKKIEEWGTSNSTNFEYDQFGRVIKVTENIDGKNFATQYEYDNFGNITKIVYPSGYTILKTYNSHGYLTSVSEQQNASLMKVIYNTAAMNARNQYTRYDCGKFTTKQSYNAFGMLESIETVNYAASGSTPIHHLKFDWNTTTGNPNFRENLTKSLIEDFGFDNLNRLTGYTIRGGAALSVGYEDNGNVNFKSDAGTYQYSSLKPHAVEYIEDPPDTMLFRPVQHATYNSFNRPVTITQGDYELEITYGVDQHRRKMEIKKDGIVQKTITYAGNYEKIETGGNVYEVHYIATGPGLIGIKVRKNGGNDTLFYVHSDHLGSILKLTDENGSTRYEQNFDPWGRERNPSDWTYTSNPNPKPVWLIHGFTGHEHLDEVGLINMNARLYDPVAGRMLSPDNYVQDATSTQSYNRYSYVENNPLVYTDPDGDFIVAAAVYFMYFTETGYDIQKYISPAAARVDISTGTDKRGISIQTSVGIPQVFVVNARSHKGIGYYWKNDEVTPGWQATSGYEVGAFGVITVGSTNYITPGSPEFNQRTGHARIGVPFHNIKYENDWFFGLRLGDSGDRYRTAAFKVQSGSLSAGINLFTGDPGMDGKYRKINPDKGGKYGQYEENAYGDNPDKYRSGVGYIGIGPFRIGNDSEKRRDRIQNQLIHDKVSHSPHFKVIDRPNKFYFQFGTGGGYLW